jgi:hypothetical protein
MLKLALALFVFAIGSQSMASVLIESKSLAPISSNDTWRKIGIKVTNLDTINVPLKDNIIEYYFSDSSGYDGNIWMLQINNPSWIYHVQGISYATLSIDSISVNKRVARIKFNDSISIPSQGVLEVQFGLHRKDYSEISQNLDSSFVNTLVYSNNTKVRFGSQINSPTVPPTPPIPPKDTALLGKDADGNFVRDDIDSFINAQAVSDTAKILFRKMSITLDSIIVSTDTNETIRLNRKYLALINCAIGKMEDDGVFSDFSPITSKMFVKQINTPVRLAAYFAFKKRVAGRIFKLGNAEFTAFCLEDI